MGWRAKYADTRTTAADAIARIQNGRHIFLGSGAAHPVSLVEELVAQAGRFADITIAHLMTLGPAPYADPQYSEAFRHNAFFIGANVREAVHDGRADYTPVFLSQIPGLIQSRRMPVDVALIQVSPPDKFGFVNLGVSVDVVKAAVGAADLVIAEINPHMPVVYGGGFLPMDCIDAWMEVDTPLLEAAREPLDEVAREIGRNVASLIEDGATLQMGIGMIPDAALEALQHHKDLGVWTEMFSDGVIDLLENGNITGRYKTTHPGKVSSSFTFGTRRLYDYIDRNPTFTFQTSDHINDPMRIARQHRMVAINSALQIDLTGQVCADSIGTRFYSGIGGQVDFIRGASMCPGGAPIIAVRSTAKHGELSRIVATLDQGAGVVTSRGDVRYVVTEYGVADLQGKSIRERTMALIAIAHPEFRSGLLDAAKARRYVFADQLAPAAEYPKHYEEPVTTSDGHGALLRPLRPTDEPKVSALFYALSAQTIYRRWLSVLKRLPAAERVRGLRLDYTRNVGVVIEHAVGTLEPEIVAMARYDADPSTRLAEVAFVVRDDWQNRGLGRQMMGGLAVIARDAGLAGFTAEVQEDNPLMLAVFRGLGLHVESRTVDGVCHLTMTFKAASEANPGPGGSTDGPPSAA